MLALIKPINQVRVSESDELIGLDSSIHGEQAYDAGSM